MHREISSQEFYCRYLSLDLNSEPTNRMCSGDFFSFISKELLLTKLPYDIKVIDLVISHCLDTDLFVELPKLFFENWKNFPIIENHPSDDLKDVGFYNLVIISDNVSSLSELSHPYDEELKDRFTSCFSILTPTKLTKYQHPNGRCFYPNEAYLAYWKSYIILEAVNECRFIDRYVAKDKGEMIFKKTVDSINKQWMKKYASIFNAISHYRTLTSLYHHMDAPTGLKYADSFPHLLDRANISIEELNTGLGLLLELHNTWLRNLNNNGISQFKSALESLKRDIYFLFEWLCGLGCSENDMFELWTYKNRQPELWSQLSDVLDFEDISFKTTFEIYVPIYCQEDSNYFNLEALAETYEQLKKYHAFDIWVRAFSDLHASMNNVGSLSFIQPRLLDSLLVLTIRTEVLIRTMYVELTREQDNDDFKRVLGDLAKYCKNVKDRTILSAIFERVNLTKLNSRPNKVFKQIEQIDLGKKWSNKQKYIFKIILKFITSRNYFAHHYYKDHELNNHTNELCREVLTRDYGVNS